MKLVILDAFAANPGDLDWSFLNKYGEVTVYDRTPDPALTVERTRDADVVILNKTPLTRETVERLPKLRLVAVLATGYNVVDAAACRERGVPVVNVPSYAGFAVAQQTMAFLLAFASRVAEHSASVLSGDWVKSPDFSYFTAPTSELCGKTLGLIGYGDIGRRVAKMAAAFEMRVLVFTAHPEKYPDAPVTFVPLDTLLAQSDYVSLHVPQTKETVKLADEGFLSKMKPTAVLINTARGGEVDEEAVASALNEGRLAGFAADVLSTEPPRADNPLLHAKNVLLTPHIAWAAYETRVRLLEILDKNLAAFFAGSPINVVNP